MAIRIQIDQVDTAVVSTLQATLNNAFGSPVDVDSIGARDFDDNGDLILSPPCVRVRFRSADYQTLRDTQKLTYGAALLFDCFVYAENLRSKLDERLDTLNLVAYVQDALAGARLQLADGTKTEPTEVVGVGPVMNEDAVIDQFYSVTFRVNGIAQFSGVNANLGVTS